jgi:hypothetical protein
MVNLIKRIFKNNKLGRKEQWVSESENPFAKSLKNQVSNISKT